MCSTSSKSGRSSGAAGKIQRWPQTAAWLSGMPRGRKRTYRTGHIEGDLTASDIEKATKPALLSAVKTKDMSAALERNDSLTQALGLTGTPGLIVLPLKNATPAKITVIPGAVGAEQLMAAIDKAGR